MADVLLTHSYFLKFDPKEYKAKMPYPPLGTLYAANYLRSKGYSVAFFDSMLAEREQDILHSIKLHNPRIVVIYDDDFNYLTKMCLSRMRQAAFVLSRLAKGQDCIVVVHGSDASDHVEEYLSHGADFVIIGEGERTLGELVNALLKFPCEDFSSIDGLALRIQGGEIQKNSRRALLKNLDSLPFPAWNLAEIEKYRTIWKKNHGYFSMNMVTTRGCPFHCNWCAKPIYGQVYNSRSPENVVEEMLFLKRTYQPDHIWFCDDIFGLKPGWILHFSQVVQKKLSVIPFKCLARVDLLLKENAIQHLANAGCKTVWVGAESGSQKILDGMEKGTTVEQIYEATELLHLRGIRVGFFLQFGYPGETKEDIEKTLKMVKDCKPDEIGVSVSYPLPGTKFYEHVKAQLGEKQNWIDSADFDPMFQATYTHDYYRVLHKVVHKKFSIWRGMRIIDKMLSNPWELQRASLRSVASMVYHSITLPLELTRLKSMETERV